MAHPCLFQPEVANAWHLVSFSPTGQKMAIASRDFLEVYETGRCFNRIAQFDLYRAGSISWAPDELHFIASVGTDSLIFNIFEVLANDEIKISDQFDTKIDFCWFIDTERFVYFREDYLGYPKPGAVLSIGRIGSRHFYKQALESHDSSPIPYEKFPVAYAKNILIQAKDEVLKGWLVDHSGPIAPLIGASKAGGKIENVDISCSGMWAATLDEFANIDIHKIDTMSMNLRHHFRLRNPQSASRFYAIIGLAELSSPAKVVLAISDSSSHVTVHEIGSEIRQISSADGDVAKLSEDGNYLYTTSQYRRFQNDLTITPINDSHSTYVISLASLLPNRISVSPTSDLLLAWRYDNGGSVQGWQLDITEPYRV